MKTKSVIASLVALSLSIGMPSVSATVHGPGSFYTQFSGDGATRVNVPVTAAGDYGMGIRAARTDSLDRLVIGVTDDSGLNIYLQRLTAAGEIDTSFNDSRIECFTRQNATYLRDVKIDSYDDVYAIVDCGAYESAVVKLRGVDGEYDSTFGDGGFLWLSDTNGARTSALNSIAIDDLDRIYILGQIEDGAGDIVNGVWRFSRNGQARNFPFQVPSNQITMSVNEDVLALGSASRSGILEYDYDSDKVMATGRYFVADNLLNGSGPQSFLADVWITRIDPLSGLVRWDSDEVYWTSGLTPSDTSSSWNTNDYTPTDITMDDSGWVTVVGSDAHTYSNVDSFGVQIKPDVDDTYWYSFNQTSQSNHYCWAQTVMADSRLGFYVAGYCDSGVFLQRFNSDTTRDVAFQPPGGNLTPYAGNFEPNYFVGSGTSLSLVGFIYDFASPDPYSVSLVKYRTTAYDDTPPAPAPVVVAPAPAPVVVAPAPAVAAPAAPAQPTMVIKQKTAGVALANQIGMTVTPKAKVKLTVAKASKKICKVSGGKLVALKPGNCSVTVSVTPAKTKQVKKPKATKQSTVVVIS